MLRMDNLLLGTLSSSQFEGQMWSMVCVSGSRGELIVFEELPQSVVSFTATVSSLNILVGRLLGGLSGLFSLTLLQHY